MCSNESRGVSPTDMSATASIRMPLPITQQPQPAQESLAPTPTRQLLPIDHYRLQLYQYAVAERLRYSFPFPTPLPGCYSLFPRSLQPEEPKPQHSYIGLIAMAILSSAEGKLVLSDIYQYILDNYPYFRTRGPGWRNSIRHNLSLNDCFIKAGRSANGKGHYWAVHPANVDDFRKGDFRRRKAQRKVRRHMGLSVDEEGADSPSPPPLSISPIAGPSTLAMSFMPNSITRIPGSINPSRKRQKFDVASLLAPDSVEEDDDNNIDEDIDVVNNDNLDSRSSDRFNPNMPQSTNFGPSTLRPWPVLPLVSHYYQALLQARVPNVGEQNLENKHNNEHILEQKFPNDIDRLSDS